MCLCFLKDIQQYCTQWGKITTWVEQTVKAQLSCNVLFVRYRNQISDRSDIWGKEGGGFQWEKGEVVKFHIKNLYNMFHKHAYADKTHIKQNNQI